MIAKNIPIGLIVPLKNRIINNDFINTFEDFLTKQIPIDQIRELDFIDVF